MHQVECNMFFKGHVERARMDVCNLVLLIGSELLSVNSECP